MPSCPAPLVLPEPREGSERGAPGLLQSARRRGWEGHVLGALLPAGEHHPMLLGSPACSLQVTPRAPQGGSSGRHVAMGKVRVGDGFLHSPSSPTIRMQTDPQGRVTSHLALFIQMSLHSGELILKEMSGSQCTKLLSLDFPSLVDWSKSSLRRCPHPNAWSAETTAPRVAGSQAGPEVQAWPSAARPPH